jgi:hypothetical protein
MRLDRLLTLYLFGPLSRLRRLPPGTIRIPILMYHSISDDPETGHPYYWINTKPALFAEHMKFLHDNNYQVIPLSTAVGMIRAGNPKSQTLNPKSEIQNVDQSTNQLITQSTSHLPDPNQPINQLRCPYIRRWLPRLLHPGRPCPPAIRLHRHRIFADRLY